jgi:Ca2+-binding EF-hand superfamily protein
MQAAVLVCVLCGILSFAQDQIANGTEDFTDEWYAVRAVSFAGFDQGGKGYIDIGDWPGRNRAFRLMDVNRDGRVTLEEFQSLRNRWRNRTFENLDLDGNRIITRDEWMDIAADFDRLDRNKDGIIERHEFYTSR